MAKKQILRLPAWTATISDTAALSHPLLSSSTASHVTDSKRNAVNIAINNRSTWAWHGCRFLIPDISSSYFSYYVVQSTLFNSGIFRIQAFSFKFIKAFLTRPHFFHFVLPFAHSSHCKCWKKEPTKIMPQPECQGLQFPPPVSSNLTLPQSVIAGKMQTGAMMASVMLYV